MYAYADKSKENKSRAASNFARKKKSKRMQEFGLEDNRSKAIAQRRLQETANNSPQAKQSAQLQTMADNYSARKQQPIKNSKEKKSRTSINSVTQRKIRSKQNFGIMYNRPGETSSITENTISRRKNEKQLRRIVGQHQTLENENSVRSSYFSPPVNQWEWNIDFLPREAKSEVRAVPIQRVLNNIDFSHPSTTGVDRPKFLSGVGKMRTDAQSLFPEQTIHMAHRLSWQSIRDTILVGNTNQIDNMIENLTVPQRNFGEPSKGGVSKGDKQYYNAIKGLLDKYYVDSEVVFRALNSSPYNLRPGDGPTNSAIGGGADAHRDETKSTEPMTPQSKALLPSNTSASSDFMDMKSYKIWENNFNNDYLQPFLEAVEKL